jgi:hypothetical protein
MFLVLLVILGKEWKEQEKEHQHQADDDDENWPKGGTK